MEYEKNCIYKREIKSENPKFNFRMKPDQNHFTKLIDIYVKFYKKYQLMVVTENCKFIITPRQIKTNQ